MQNVSALYINIISNEPHWFETKLVIDNVGTFDETQLFALSTNHAMFTQTVKIGLAVAGEIEVKMHYPSVQIPTMACLRPYVRVCNATQQSEWIPQGVYYIDTRERTKDDTGLSFLTIHGYDAMLKAEQMWTDRGTLDWEYGTVSDWAIVDDIATIMDVQVDPRTYSIMTKWYEIPMPISYTLREILSYIASMYAGCFIITDEGKLRLVAINELPPETNYLIDNVGNWITFGGDRILV